MPCDASRILRALSDEAARTAERDDLGRAAVRALRDAFPQATWVGIYWLEGGELVLGPFEGPETEHTRIPVGSGVCGTAVAEDEDQLVDDVRTRDDYLACAPAVRSEMVALIRSQGAVVGQFDLDADTVGAFSGDDFCVLRAAADGFGGLLAPRRGA